MKLLKIWGLFRKKNLKEETLDDHVIEIEEEEVEEVVQETADESDTSDLEQEVAYLDVTKKQIVTQEEDDDELEGDETLEDAILAGDKLLLKIPNACKKGYVITNAKGEEKRPSIGNSIPLQKGDRVTCMEYRDNACVVKQYCIVKITNNLNSILTDQRSFDNVNQVKEIEELPSVVRRKIINFFNLVGKPEQLV